MPVELFNFGQVAIDVTAARRLTRHRRPTARVDLRRAMRFIEHGWVRINKRHAVRGRLKAGPLLLATILGRRVLIDGWHRAYRAHRAGRRFLTAHLMTAAESAAVTRDPLRYEPACPRDNP